MLTKCICVWQDETNPDGRWVVSRDEIDLWNNETDHTSTLDICDDEETALEKGKARAAAMGLPLFRYESNANGFGRPAKHEPIEQ